MRYNPKTYDIYAQDCVHIHHKTYEIQPQVL